MDENLPPMQVSNPIPPAQPPVIPIVPLPIPPIPPVPTPTDSKILTKIALVFLIGAFLSLVGFLAKDFLGSKKKEVACTMEAKVCPDGTSVGRVAPDCEFAPCPSPTATPDPTADWKTYTNSEIGFSFKYPQEWTMKEAIVPRVAAFDTGSGMPGDFFVAYHKNIEDLSKWLLDNRAGEIINTVNIKGNLFSIIKGGTLEISREYAIKLDPNNYLRLVIEPFPNSNLSDEVINQILSTFKFLEATPSASPQ